ncbi:MAG: hypothetical protein KIT54_04375 [Phycisphaeraceae bacterium]|nr:hypothetical protein [Phycisphaeraceae bacterium]
MRVRHGIAVAMLVSACGLPLAVAQAQTSSNAYRAHVQDNSEPAAPGEGTRRRSRVEIR